MIDLGADFDSMFRYLLNGEFSQFVTIGFDMCDFGFKQPE